MVPLITNIPGTGTITPYKKNNIMISVFLLTMREYNYKQLVRERDIDRPVAGPLETTRRGFTKYGRGAVLKNVMQYIIDDTEQLKLEVTKGERDADAFLYNAMVFRVMTGVQNILDAVARFCEDTYPSAAPRVDDRIYFDRYSFEREEIRTIHYLQKKIAVLAYGGKTFYDMANYVKHEMPWVGRVTASDSAQKEDILDERNHGLVYDMIVPAANHAFACVSFVYTDAQRSTGATR